MDVAIIGVGQFGSELAKDLTKKGANILLVDINKSKLEPFKDTVTSIAIADASSLEVLEELNIEKFQVVVVALGTHFETSVLCISLLQKAGVKHIIARANNDIQKEIFMQIGADEVVLPEANTAHRLSFSIVHKNIKDIVSITDGIVVASVTIPNALAGRTLIELELRAKHGINFLARKKEAEIIPYIDPAIPLSEGETYVIAGVEENITALFGNK